MVKSGFWGHIYHSLGICFYCKVVLDFCFGHLPIVWDKVPNKFGFFLTPSLTCLGHISQEHLGAPKSKLWCPSKLACPVKSHTYVIHFLNGVRIRLPLHTYHRTSYWNPHYDTLGTFLALAKWCLAILRNTISNILARGGAVMMRLLPWGVTVSSAWLTRLVVVVVVVCN